MEMSASESELKVAPLVNFEDAEDLKGVLGVLGVRGLLGGIEPLSVEILELLRNNLIVTVSLSDVKVSAVLADRS